MELGIRQILVTVSFGSDKTRTQKKKVTFLNLLLILPVMMRFLIMVGF